MVAISESAFNRLRLRQLDIVCTLSETQSMRSTAERMHLSAPALSKSLREVERLVGAELFTRTPQGMRLTPVGETFVRHARGILQRVPLLRDSRTAAGGLGARGTFRLGTAPFVAWQMVPPALRAMKERAPLPRIHFIEGRIIALAEQLVGGDLDAILTLFTPEALEIFRGSALVLEQIGTEPVVIVAASGHSRTKRKRTWTQLAGSDWILPPTSYTARILVQRAFLESGLLPPEPLIESINIPATLELVRFGLGITPAFQSTVQRDIDAGLLQRIRMESELPSVPIGLAYRQSFTDLSIINALRHLLQEARRSM